VTPEEVDCVWVQCQLGVPPDRATIRQAWDAAAYQYCHARESSDIESYRRYMAYARIFNRAYYHQGGFYDAA
jgi:hypothetical protein